MSRTTIDSGWTFSQIASPTNANVVEDWAACSKVPTSVQVELQKSGKIPDPYKGLAEWDVQCE
jgi:beta-mannosidase